MVFQHFISGRSNATVLDTLKEAPMQVLVYLKPKLLRVRKISRKKSVWSPSKSATSRLIGRSAAARIIARVAMEPEVICLMSPPPRFGSRAGRRSVQSHKLLAQEGRTMIVVTHEMGFAREVSNH